MKRKFQIGDHCYLNSGSPRFTVIDNPIDAVKVIWGYEIGIECGEFPQDCLTSIITPIVQSFLNNLSKNAIA